MKFYTLVIAVALLASVLARAPSISHQQAATDRRSLLQTETTLWGGTPTSANNNNRWNRYRGGADGIAAAKSSSTTDTKPILSNETETETETSKAAKVSKPKKHGKHNTKEDNTNSNSNNDNKYVFSVYQPGDGSDQDPDRIPRKFLSMAKGNRALAQAALETTQTWRQEHRVDTILQRPHPNFEICKIITPHSFLGRDATGHVVFFQRPAVDSHEHLTLATKNHMTNDDLLLHYVYVLEYCWNILDPPKVVVSDSNSEDGDNGVVEETRTMTSILDLTGLDLSILRHRELIGFVKQFVHMTSVHYPQRSYKTLLLNAPSWFGMLYKLISPLLRESTRAKVTILSHGQHQVDVLREVLGDDCLQYLPAELLDTGKRKTKEHTKELPVSPVEQELRDFCRARLQEAGVEMNPLIT